MIKQFNNRRVKCPLIRKKVAVSTGTPVEEIVPWFFEDGRMAIAVMDGDNIAGIITRNDIIKHYYAGILTPRMTVEQVMTKNPTVFKGKRTVRNIRKFLDAAEIRHVPVLNEQDEFVGVTSDTIVLKAALKKLRCEGDEMKRFFLGGDYSCQPL